MNQTSGTQRVGDVILTLYPHLNKKTDNGTRQEIVRSVH